MKPKNKHKIQESDFPRKQKKPKFDHKFDPLRKNKKAYFNEIKEI